MSKKDKANKMEKVKLQSKWKKAAVGDVAEVFRGNTLLKSHLDKEGKYKCILYGELYTKYSEVISTVQSHTNLKKGISSKTGDVLLPGSTTTIALDLANATALLEDDVLLGADVNIIRSKNLIEYDPVFLAFYLTHIKKKEIAIYAQGITIVHLYAKDIKKVVLIFPPLSDQKKMVAILSTWDQAIQKIEKLIEAKEKYFKWLLNELIGEKQEDAGLETVSLNNIVAIMKGIMVLLNDKKQGVPCIGSVNFAGNYTSYTTSEKAVLCDERDVLFLGYGGYVGKTTTGLKGAIGSTVLKLTPSESINNYYLYYNLYMNTIRIRNICQGSATPYIPNNFFSRYRISLPPLSRQKEIARTLNVSQEEINVFKKILNKYRQQKQALMQKLLTGEWKVN